MKKLTTALFAILFSFSAKSQLSKGIWLTGGSGSFYSYNQQYVSTTNTTDAKYTSIEFSASVGYFLIDKLAIGLRPDFSYFKGKINNQGEVAGTTKYAIGPFTRYYFLKSEKQFNLLADLSYQVGFTKEPIGTKSTGNFNNLTLLAGTEVFFNTSVGVEILLGYSKTHETLNQPSFKYTDNRNGFLVSVGFQIHLEK